MNQAISILPAHRHNAVVASLRQRIVKLERLAPEAPVRPFGLSALDDALPEGGLAPGLHEVVAAPGGNGAALGFAAALATLAAGRVLWVASPAGRLYGPGLAAFGLGPERLLLARARDAVSVLWAMEEALKSGALAAVVGEAMAVDQTAARRLQLAAAAGGGWAVLLRPEESAGVAGTATTRWRIGAAPSRPAPSAHALPGLGPARWDVTLQHGRHGARPGQWIVEWEHGTGFTLALSVAAAVVDRPLAAVAAR
jgi:protein ImuA